MHRVNGKLVLWQVGSSGDRNHALVREAEIAKLKVRARRLMAQEFRQCVENIHFFDLYPERLPDLGMLYRWSGP